ncbi:MAG: hypothetical protein JOZ42_08495, partial [Acetobacteraceae bacterium]|nr:hypothetical protein [Acetobacteraceae bacterium]
AGVNSLFAQETDAAGNTGISDAVVYTLDTTPPTVTAGLANDTGTSNSDGVTTDPTLSGTAEPGRTVTISNGSTVLGTTLANADGGWSYTPQLADGTYTLTASETDAAGNTGSAPPVTFTLDTTTAAPTLALAAGSDSGTLGDGITNVTRPTITGTAEANSTITLTDGSVLAPSAVGTAVTDANGNWSFTPLVSFPDGTYSVVATATDPAGNTSVPSAPLNVTIDTTPPSPAISGSAVLTNQPVQTISGTDGLSEAGRTVTVFDNGTSAGTAIVNPDGSWNAANVTLAEGQNSLTAQQTDAAGNTGTSAAVIYTLDTVPPTVTAGLADDSGSSNSDGVPATRRCAAPPRRAGR